MLTKTVSLVHCIVVLLAASVPVDAAIFARWFNIGPAPVTRPDVMLAWSGRVAEIAVDPADSSHWLIGAAQGGVWETRDSGTTWRPLTDSEASQAMGAIAFAPSNPSIIYAGTGEAVFRADAYAGDGLLKSTDGGATWTLLGNPQFAFTSFSDIKVDPGNADALMVATTRGMAGRQVDRLSGIADIPPSSAPRGIHKSTDGGLTWIRVLAGEETDLEMDPAQFARQYAGLGEIYGHVDNGVYRTLDSGSHWARITGPWTTLGFPIGRIELAIAPTDSSVLYVSVSKVFDATYSVQTNDLLGVWKTVNAWAPTPVWTELPAIPNDPPDHKSFRYDTWYHHDLIVDRLNANVLFFAGYWVLKYNGTSWSENLDPDGHPDFHALAWAGDRLIVGNDGGIWSSPDVGITWENHNAGLSISQMYEGALHPTNPRFVLGGSQDIGVHRWTGADVWRYLIGGDGCDIAMSSVLADTHWLLSTEFSEMTRTRDGGTTYMGADSGINIPRVGGFPNANVVPFVTRFEKAPLRSDFITGTTNLWRCNNLFGGIGAPSWFINSPTLLKAGGQPARISAMAFAPSDLTGNIYVYGTEDGQMRITQNAGATWTDLDPTGAVPNRFISDFAFQTNDATTIYVTLTGYDESTPGQPGHLFKTVNALAATPTWTDKTPEGVPGIRINVPHNTVAISPYRTNDIFVGTDKAVWFTEDDGDNWTQLGPTFGLPNVAVFELQYNPAVGLVAFTHGRGAYVFRPTFPTIVGPRDYCYYLECPEYPWLYPGDLVTLLFPLRAIITTSTHNLSATLLQSNEIIPFSGPQRYGELQRDGPPVSRFFSFIAQGACGDQITATLDLADDGTNIGTVNFTLQLGKPVTLLSEKFDGGTNLPQNWAASAGSNVVSWRISTDFRDVSSNTVLAATPSFVSDNFLYSPKVSITSTSAEVAFDHWFDFDPRRDGGVLEISSDDVSWFDLVAAGGIFKTNGYMMTMTNGSSLANRPAWSGQSGEWMRTVARLPVTFAGKDIRFRWRCSTDAQPGGVGWYVDNVLVKEFKCANPVSTPVMLQIQRGPNGVTLSFPTVKDRTYVLEYKGVLDASPWKTLQVFTGDGSVKQTGDSTFGNTQRFYQLRVE